MKHFKTVPIAALLLTLVMGAFANPVKSTDGLKSKLWLVGDSSLHAYTSMAHHVRIELSAPAAQLPAGTVKTLSVTIPVKEMRSGHPQLDKNMQTSLKAEANPDITYKMKSYEVVRSTAGAQIKTMGALSVAGVEKEIDLEGVLTEENGLVRIQGVKELLMTDFGIKPPRILLIKTTNDVKIHFDLWLDAAGELK